MHMRNHTGEEKPFACRFCNKVKGYLGWIYFINYYTSQNIIRDSKSNLLVERTRWFTLGKNHTCVNIVIKYNIWFSILYCFIFSYFSKQTFRIMHSLKLHEKAHHTKEKPFKCDLCEKVELKINLYNLYRQ